MSKSILLSRSARFCAGRVPLPPLLTSAPILGNLSFPKPKEACRSLRQRPTLEKRAAFSVSATERKRAVPPAGCGYILAEQRPDVRETQAAFKCRGALFPPFFVQKSQNLRCSMLRFFLSSHYLRLRHRLLSLLITLAGRAGATLALGVLLMLPVVYLWEVR